MKNQKLLEPSISSSIRVPNIFWFLKLFWIFSSLLTHYGLFVIFTPHFLCPNLRYFYNFGKFWVNFWKNYQLSLLSQDQLNFCLRKSLLKIPWNQKGSIRAYFTGFFIFIFQGSHFFIRQGTNFLKIWIFLTCSLIFSSFWSLQFCRF